jgi:hypothetical protein
MAGSSDTLLPTGLSMKYGFGSTSNGVDNVKTQASPYFTGSHPKPNLLARRGATVRRSATDNTVQTRSRFTQLSFNLLRHFGYLPAPTPSHGSKQKQYYSGLRRNFLILGLSERVSRYLVIQLCPKGGSMFSETLNIYSQLTVWACDLSPF